MAAIFEEGSRLYGKRKHDERVEAASQLDWFDFSQFPSLSSGVVMPRVGFNKYDPNFVYRYVSVPDLTVGEAVDLGTSCLQLAQRVAPAAAARP